MSFAVPYLAEKLAGYEAVKAVTGRDPFEWTKYGAKMAYGRFKRRYTGRRKGRPFKRLKGLAPSATANSAKFNRDLNTTGGSYGTGFACLYGTLNCQSIPYPPSSTIGVTNTRLTNLIPNMRLTLRHFSKGVKICRQFDYDSNVNTLDEDIGPIEVNWALIQAKTHREGRIPGINQATELDEIKSDFWRNNQASDNPTAGVGVRTLDFVDYPSAAASPWRMEFNCLPMNPSNKYRILTRKKRILAAREVGNANNTPYYWKIDGYYKIGRQVEYDDGGSLIPNKPIYEIWWYNTVTGGTKNGASIGTHPETNAGARDVLKTWENNVYYYHEKL